MDEYHGHGYKIYCAKCRQDLWKLSAEEIRFQESGRYGSWVRYQGKTPIMGGLGVVRVECGPFVMEQVETSYALHHYKCGEPFLVICPEA